VLEDAIAQAAHNFTKELRVAYNEAEITKVIGNLPKWPFADLKLTVTKATILARRA
jgi:hypothetical protein